MANINSLLQARTKQASNQSKMKALSKQSANGDLTSFSGMFSLVELTLKEKKQLTELLLAHAREGQVIEQDLEKLVSLTCEVKAINNQAALLHGERIKKAHQILTCYKEGAFTAWLITTYGNRQTPYNLMQYYDFHCAMPKSLHRQLEAMPRQAIYTLATRIAPLELKEEIVKNYNGETKSEMIAMIQAKFPLQAKDRRQSSQGIKITGSLKRIYKQLKPKEITFSKEEKAEIKHYLDQLYRLIGES